MLETLRNASKTWPFKVFLGLLLASFCFWGVESYLSGGTFSSYVIKVGSDRVDVKEFDQTMQLSLQRIQQQLGDAAKDRTTLKAIIPMVQQQVTQRLIQQKLLQEAAQDLGLVVSDALIKEQIAKQFTDEKGVFRADLFKRALNNMGLSEKQFIALLKEEIARSMVAEAIFPGIRAPKPLVTPLVVDYYTPRSFSMIRFTAKDLPAPQLPTIDQLKAFYQAHKQRYLIPEHRSFELLSIAPETSADNDSTSASAHHKRLQAIEDALAGGATFPEVAKDFGLVLTTHGPLDASASGEKLDPAIIKAVFSQELGIEGDLIETKAKPNESTIGTDKGSPHIASPIASHIAKVTSITPAKVPDFDSIKGQLTVDYMSQEQIVHLKKKVDSLLPSLSSKSLTFAALPAVFGSASSITPQSFHNVLLVDHPSKHQKSAKTQVGQQLGLSSTASSLPPQVREAIARTPKGAYFGLVVDTTAYVGQVNDFGTISPQNYQAGMQQVSEGIKIALTGMATQALFAEIERQHPVVINQTLYQDLAKHYIR